MKVFTGVGDIDIEDFESRLAQLVEAHNEKLNDDEDFLEEDEVEVLGSDFGITDKWTIADCVGFVDEWEHLTFLHDEDAVRAFLENVGPLGFDRRQFEDAFTGVYESKQDWAREIVSANLESGSFAERYFDYDSFIRDAEHDGYWFHDIGYKQVAVFCQ